MKTVRAIIALFLLLLGGCDEIEKISGAEFQKQYELNKMQTVQWSEYLGQRDGKAFMRIKTMSTISSDPWKERIVYTDLKELPLAFRDQLLKDGKVYSPTQKNE